MGDVRACFRACSLPVLLQVCARGAAGTCLHAETYMPQPATPASQPPKKKGGKKKKKKDDGSEPQHDPSWERVRCAAQPLGMQFAARRAFGRLGQHRASSSAPTHTRAHFHMRATCCCAQSVETGSWERPVTDLPGDCACCC